MKQFDIVFVSNESSQEAIKSKRYAIFHNENECFYCKRLITFQDAIMFRNTLNDVEDEINYSVRPYLFIVPVFKEEEFTFGEKVLASNNLIGYGNFYYISKTDNGKFVVSDLMLG